MGKKFPRFARDLSKVWSRSGGLIRIRWWVLAGLLVLPVLFLIDRPEPKGPRYRAEWLEAGGTHLRSLRTGTGDTTLLLLHGYGESLLAFRGLVDRLALDYEIAAVDLPGSGLSENPPGSYHLDSLVAVLEAYVVRWISGPVVVVGHSMGGEIGTELALKRPDRIVRVVLISPAGYGLGFGLTDEPFSNTQQTLAAWSVRARELLIPVEDADWIADPPDMPKAADSDSADRAAAAAVLRDLDFTALRDRFADLQQPTLLIWGRLDPLIPIEIGRKITAELTCGRMVELANSWHRPHVEQPERVVREILEFLANETSCASL